MSAFTVKWGILATGGIAKTFATDLLVDPKTRGVKDLVHTVVAAASSTSASRSEEFLKEINAPASAKAYGSYKELVADPNVDIIYVATPHSHHYQNVMQCLEAGKNVLCEKSFTTNAKQARKLVEEAKKRSLFLMEAEWTRYFPISFYVRDLITSGRIGKIHRVQADNSLDVSPDEMESTHRMVNPDLAGGALLDLGIYALLWVFQTLYSTVPKAERQAPKVTSSMNKYKSGVDETTTVLLTFPRSDGDVQAVATTSMKVSAEPGDKSTAGPSVRIFGEKGEIQVFPPAHRPTSSQLILTDGTVEKKDWEQPGPGKGSGWYNGFAGNNAEGEGHGMFWEADEAGAALRDGRKESRYQDLDESIAIMDVMDQVRQQNGLVYPQKIETTDYPVDL